MTDAIRMWLLAVDWGYVLLLSVALNIAFELGRYRQRRQYQSLEAARAARQQIVVAPAEQSVLERLLRTGR